MRDQEEEYPRHQPGRDTHDHHDPFASDTEDEGELEDRPHRAPLHQREAATTPELPHRHVSKALIAGLVLGALVSLQGVLLTLKNTDIYHQAAKYMTSNMPLGLATTVLWIFLLGLAISTLIYLFGGMIIGRIAVHRRWAFIGGFAGGVFSSIVGALLKLIPSYPNAGNTGFSGGLLGFGGGFVALLISTILVGVLAGLITLLGAWLTTRHHPYYVGYNG